MDKCERCGRCCASEACKISQVLFNIGEKDRCVCLEFKDGLAACGMITRPLHYLDLVMKAPAKTMVEEALVEYYKGKIKIGKGCDSIWKDIKDFHRL